MALRIPIAQERIVTGLKQMHKVDNTLIAVTQMFLTLTNYFISLRE
jgi:hypothetical protein